MGKLYEHKFRIKVRETEISVEDRIRVKAQLWDFIQDTKDSWLSWEDEEQEMLEQLITTCFTILMPHYTLMEIYGEVSNIYNTFKRKLPQNFFNIYSGCYTSYIKARLRNFP